MSTISINFLNWLVVFSGAIGIVIAVWGVFSTLYEYLSLQVLGVNGGLRITTITGLLRESLAFAGQVVVLLVGVSLVLNENTSTIGVFAWSVSSWLKSGGCLTAQWRRRRHLEIAEEEAAWAIAHGSKRSDDPKKLPNTAEGI